MLKILKLLPICVVLLSACATPVPLVVSCPPPPPAPAALTAPVSTGPSLSERYENLIKEFRSLLMQAAQQ